MKKPEAISLNIESIGLPDSYIDINNFKNKSVNYTEGLVDRCRNLNYGETINYRCHTFFIKK